MKKIYFNNLVDKSTKKPLCIEVADAFDEYSEEIVQAKMLGRIMGKRFRRLFSARHEGNYSGADLSARDTKTN